MGIFRQNLRSAVRQLQLNPGFTFTVVLTLALSIGANTAIFSIVNGLMLKSLPYSQPERMGTIYTRVTGPAPSDERHHLNGEQWELLRDHVPSLISAIAGPRSSGVNFQTGSRVQYLHAGRVSAHYFDVLAIRPVIGRNFSEDDDRPHGPKVVLLSYGLWRSTLGSNPDIVGAPVQLKGEPYTVIGVLPEGATTPLNADLYMALQPSRDGEGGGTNFDAITRLRDGANWQQADAEIAHAWSLRTQRYELSNSPGAQVTYYSVPLQKGQSARIASAGFDLDGGSRAHPADGVCQSCRPDPGAHVAAHSRSRYPIGARRLALANSKATVGREPGARASGRSRRCGSRFCRPPRLALASPRIFPAYSQCVA